ncbi:MAG: TonB-dependent receptor [Cyclobacteriaceae bacterium]|nr:TonB-dependent receptor [Cyclobacteriaceae bacterium]MDH4295355.1 TonB-dependent receptor [Cyclobacteriaceae bacterium]MDH5247472.1 TonB-dependent receptor [Cyclobacteriaceae bacterium]
MMRRLLLSLFALSVSLNVFAQVGTIKGNVKDASTGEGIIGANVYIAGTTQGASVDINGDFEISNIKAGNHDLVLSFISYKTDTLKNVTVYPDQTTVVNHKMVEESQQLTEVVVSGTKITNTDYAVITELRKNDLVAVGISSQQISMSQDRDAAQVLKRLPGVTIVNNRFVNVRGLSERYSTVMLNGVIAPSSEIDSKAFAFDMIPSSMLDRMLVYKSGSPELPGEFAGADISIYTKSVVEENALTLSVSGSFRPGTTGKNVALGQEKGRMDWLGMDDGTRQLPDKFPNVNLRTLSLSDPSEQNKLVGATRMLPNTWGTRNLNASPDFRANLDFSRSIRIGGMRLDNITSLSYTQTNQLLELSQNYYDVFSEAGQKSTPRYRYNDVRFTQTNRVGAVANFTLTISPSNRIEFRNFYNQQGQNQSTQRTGTEDALGYDVKNQALNYFSRSLYAGQLSGKHSLSDAVNFTWIFGYNNTTANQPDYRRIRSQRSIGTNDPFAIVIPPSASSFDAGRFYSNLNEQTYSAAGNLEIKLNPQMDPDRQSKIIAGYYLEQKDRVFDARWFSNKWKNTNEIDNSLLLQPFDEVFVKENMGTKFILDEGTNVGGGANAVSGSYDRYDGDNRLLAGYAGIVTPFADKFRLNAGLRLENNVQKIYVYDENGTRLNATNSPLTVPMPFLNLTYNITSKVLMRLAYSKTVNRPVFRELAPFNFYDFDRNADVSGNKNLKTAKIDNVDLSWELYPSKAEKISFGVFYKNFKDPIEQVLRPGSNLIYNYENADKATSYGVEAEIRKSLENVGSLFFRKLTLVFNGALIKSQISLPASLSNLDHNRAMQGQSPYVANASVYYSDYENGLQVSVQYNVYGKRIFAVGDKDSNATQYEMPRNQIDLTFSKRLSQHFELKFGIQDILNQEYRLIQDSNRDKKITKVDESIQSYKWGQYTTLGIVWKL